jgi:tRNA-dihydrouridine synthase
MIGRGALGAPWVFAGREVARAERARVIGRHVALIRALLPPRQALVQLKKHLAWYLGGLPGATDARPALFQARAADDVLALFWRAWHAADGGQS